jgi:hypothetical protein
VVGIVGRRRLDAVHPRDQLAVAGRRRRAKLEDLVELLQLRDP